MLPLPAGQMTFICGPVASGKTFTIKQWLSIQNRYVVFDGTGEFLDAAGVETIWASPKSLHKRIADSPYYYRLVYQPGRNRREDFRHVLNVLWWKNHYKLLVCDEFHEMCPVEGTTESIEMMLRFARHDKLAFIGASQRIADVNKLYTSACRMNVLFWTQEARDLDAIEARWGCADLVTNLRMCIYDDTTQICHQIPQAVICEKGKKPYIWDFKTDRVVGETGIERDESGCVRDLEENGQGSEIPKIEAPGNGEADSEASSERAGGG